MSVAVIEASLSNIFSVEENPQLTENMRYLEQVFPSYKCERTSSLRTIKQAQKGNFISREAETINYSFIAQRVTNPLADLSNQLKNMGIPIFVYEFMDEEALSIENSGVDQVEYHIGNGIVFDNTLIPQINKLLESFFADFDEIRIELDDDSKFKVFGMKYLSDNDDFEVDND